MKNGGRLLPPLKNELVVRSAAAGGLCLFSWARGPLLPQHARPKR